uniref:Pesticidal crystal cry8Ba protein n=1 Tax=Tanacetum cinerariifolium TaxID=118510 RepID=A0A699JXZ4_TANCI|nr:pesticidal crystal cry8Ba protein [Tanacetum cinerariifolium]
MFTHKNALKKDDDAFDEHAPSAPPLLYSDGPIKLPTYDTSSLEPWHSLIAFEACVRVCEVAWAKGCMEASTFLENGYALLRSTFGVQQFLLQSKEELLVTRASEDRKVGTALDTGCGSVTETKAFDIVLEVAMKVHNFHQRNLVLENPWKWLLVEFASYYGVSDAYTKLRYLSYIMDVATPTADCLSLVYDLLLPVMMKGHKKSMLSHQEVRLH